MKRIQLKRRGIVLLVVLSLLALFTIFAVSFLLVSGQYRTAAAINVRTQRTVTPPDRFAEEALYQLLRDTEPTARSALRNHSLLNDLYGSDGVAGIVVFVDPSPIPSQPPPPVPVPPPINLPNQFVRILVQQAPNMPNFQGRLSRVPGYYAGRVITFIEGPAKGLSARVVSYAEPVDGFDGADDLWGLGQSATPENRFDSGSDDFAWITFEWLEGNPGNFSSALPVFGTRFIINGQPFNGMGHGYDTATGNIDARFRSPGADLLLQTPDDGVLPSGSAALLPNSTAGQVFTSGTGAGALSINIGGADESWDTFDYQNMHLAMVPPDLQSIPEIIPSFHRPALVQFWFNWALSNVPGLNSLPSPGEAFLKPYGDNRLREPTGGDDPGLPIASRDAIVDILRGCILRPLPEDHPNFRWNNDKLNYLGNSQGGEWDVDNDADGIPDSIWVDIGLPTQVAADGKRFRPLVAILCQDLDGRLNLNAHGQDSTGTSLVRFEAVTDPATGNLTGHRFVVEDSAGAYASGNSVRLPRGRGVGPAEISLAPLVFESTRNDSSYAAGSPLIRQEGAQLIRGRYRATGSASSVLPGLDGLNDPLSRLVDQPIPANYLAGLTVNASRAGYAFPADLRGFTGVGVDYYGQPLTTNLGIVNEAVDDPYEMVQGTHYGDLLSSFDSPYTVAELERILRYNDVDASQLPDRLIQLARDTFAIPANRRRVTVQSSHIPVVNSVAFPGGRSITYHGYINAEGFGSNRGTQTILDAYFQRIYVALNNAGRSPSSASTVLRQIVPFEILHGERFDLNRPFGNGVDDNGNGVVDEPLENLPPTLAWPGLTGIRSDFFNGEPVLPPITTPSTPPDPRVLYARHLYCLMMLLANPGPNLPAARSSDSPPEVARRIAQYCVNVVDYRDPDAIMTAFEYDLNPFDGWDVDSNIATNDGAHRGLVWGCESPDLLITETLAFHDRRVKDTNFDTTQRKRDAVNPASRDEDLDQYRIPQGSLFLELHCPRTDNALLPRELYTRVGTQEFLDLGKTDVNGFPIWRVAISNNSEPPVERPWDGTANPSPSSERFEPSTIDRIIWFTTVPAHGADPYKIFYGRTPNPRIEPNGYTVVGPRPITHIGSLDGGADGDPTTWDWAPSQQRLEMGPPFQAYDMQGNLRTQNAFIRAPLSIICAADPPPTWVAGGPINAIGMNISEPLPQGPADNYYQQPNPGNAGYAQDPPDAYEDTANPTYTMPDQPFDEMAGMPLENFLRTGSPAAFRRSAYLQRLADPTRPWDELTNPYLTVDWTTIDLTVFNGEEDTSKLINNPPEWIDPSDPDPLNSNPPERFNSRQRDGSVASFSGAVNIVGGANTITRTDGGSFVAAGFQEGQQLLVRGTPPPPPGPNNFAIFSSTNLIIESVTPATLTVTYPVIGFTLVDENVQRARLYAYTGNRLSPSTKEPWVSQPPPPVRPVPPPAYPFWPVNLGHTLGYLNEGLGNPQVPSPGYAGAPSTPFPWLPWMDRPFASAYELLDVPASAPSRLLYEFSSWNTNSRFYNIRKADRANPYLNDNTFARFYGSHAHLMNFLLSANSPGATDTNLFHHLFEAVHVPSRFVGADRWYNPTDFANSSAFPNAISFRPPFNKLSRFRDPGRININTIVPDSPTSSRVWEGISKLFPEMDSTQVRYYLSNGGLPNWWHPGIDGAWGRAGQDDDLNGTVDDLSEAGWPGSDDLPIPHPGADLAWGRAGIDDDGNGVIDDISEAGSAGSDDLTRHFLQRLLLSRQGYGRAPGDLLTFNPNFPTRFANPFRAAAHADMMPAMSGGLLRKPGIEATLLRSDIIPHVDRGNNRVYGGLDDDGNNSFDDGQSIFEVGRDDDLSRKEPLFVVDRSMHIAPPSVTTALDQTRNQDDNSFLRHQALHRLGSLLTTNSNVYAIWITVGYFELEENLPRNPSQPANIRTLVHPDGLRLGAELGLETGEVRRNRFFYMIDRSIPCAFEPGIDHNIENIILLRRSIE